MAKKFKSILTGLLTIAVVSMSLQSCLKDQEDVFDESAAQRLTNYLQSAQKVLVGAENGWRMYYYPHPDQDYGGFVYTLNFTNDEVTVYSEIFDGAYTSLYKMTRDSGPILSFDTNNYAFHYFATPSGGSRNLYNESGLYQAYKGDFEFLILSATKDEVVLKGKRSGSLVKMYPLAAGEDPEQVTIDVYNTASSVYVSQFIGSVGGKEVFAYLDLDYRWISFYEINGEEVGDLIDESAFAYTETGLKLYNAITVGSANIEFIEWIADSGSIAVGGDVIKGQLPEGWHPYEDFIGDWTLYYRDGAATLPITIEENTPGKSYIVKKLSNQFDVNATYSLAAGCISICAQIVGNNGTYDIQLAAWDSNAGYVNYNSAIGMNGTFISSEDNTTVTWGDNGVWGTYSVESFILYHFSGSTRIGAAAAPWIFANNSYQCWGWQKMERK